VPEQFSRGKSSGKLGLKIRTFEPRFYQGRGLYHLFGKDPEGKEGVQFVSHPGEKQLRLYFVKRGGEGVGTVLPRRVPPSCRDLLEKKWGGESLLTKLEEEWKSWIARSRPTIRNGEKGLWPARQGKEDKKTDLGQGMAPLAAGEGRRKEISCNTKLPPKRCSEKERRIPAEPAASTKKGDSVENAQRVRSSQGRGGKENRQSTGAD